jgi:hypothetical protein
MAIPGFTADAALYPTSSHYRMVSPNVAGVAQQVTAQIGAAQARRLSRSHSTGWEVAEWLQACTNACNDVPNQMRTEQRDAAPEQGVQR